MLTTPSFTLLTRSLLGLILLTIVHTAEAQTVAWNNWAFDYNVSTDLDGLSLLNVKYQGRLLIYRISLPVTRVFYSNNLCGPFADRLGGTLSPIPWANNATMAQREFTLNGHQWYEIGIRGQIGSHEVYQVYYLSDDGVLDAHIYSRGIQCAADHVHYPNWRIDFDIDGGENDTIEHNTGTAFQTNTTEFDANVATAVNQNWRVRDTLTDLFVDVLPGLSNFTIPNFQTVAATDYSNNTVFGRHYNGVDTAWTYGPDTQVPGNNGEGISDTDIVLWYEGRLPYLATDDPAVWHSTGIRLVSSLVATTPTAQSVVWNDWTFDTNLSGDLDGLSLLNVRYQGRLLIYRMSMPVMRVFYNNNACGPFADRLGGTLAPIPWANFSTLAQREFTLNGRQWYEIGIRDQIGSYDIYQVYYLSSDGILDAHIYSKGLQCQVDHIHYPNWRIDFDLDGGANDTIEHKSGTVFQPNTIEFDANAATATNHGWRVRDTVTNLYVDLLPGFADFAIPDALTAAVTDYSQNTVFGRHYTGLDTAWTYGPNVQVPGNDGENLFNTDLVLWYEGYLPHSASEGSALWHSTGIRLVSSLAAPLPVDNTAPSAPTTLTTTLLTSTQVDLSWATSTDNIEVTGYRVERCQGAGCSTTTPTPFAQIATPATTTYSDTTVQVGLIYQYRVRAADAAGNLSSYSTAISVTVPDTIPPTVPKELKATPMTSNRVNLSWTASTDNVGVTFYRIERCQGSGCTTFALITSVTAPATTYINTGLLVNTTYQYRIRAVDAAGNPSGYSTTVSATVTDTTLPAKPTGLTATAPTNSQINLSWTASTDNVGVSRYRVERCQGSACANFAQMIASPTGTTYSDTGRLPNTWYRYRVRAQDAAGNLSLYSSIVSIKTPQ